MRLTNRWWIFNVSNTKFICEIYSSQVHLSIKILSKHSITKPLVNAQNTSFLICISIASALHKSKCTNKHAYKPCDILNLVLQVYSLLTSLQGKGPLVEVIMEAHKKEDENPFIVEVSYASEWEKVLEDIL